MFKKLCKEIEDNIVDRLKSENIFNHNLIQKSYEDLHKSNKSKDDYINTIESQQRTIEQLLNALSDKYKHGLFVFSEDGKIPTVIRNGKILTNEMTTSFDLNWAFGEFPNISFEQIGGTWDDDERVNDE